MAVATKNSEFIRKDTNTTNQKTGRSKSWYKDFLDYEARLVIVATTNDKEEFSLVNEHITNDQSLEKVTAKISCECLFDTRENDKHALNRSTFLKTHRGTNGCRCKKMNLMLSMWLLQLVISESGTMSRIVHVLKTHSAKITSLKMMAMHF